MKKKIIIVILVLVSGTSGATDRSITGAAVRGDQILTCAAEIQDESLTGTIVTPSEVLISITAIQDDRFTTAMLSAIRKSDTAQTVEERQAVANQFARIAATEKNQWTPLYYAALNNLMMSFMDISSDQKEKLINLAQQQIEAGLKLKPEETELMVLKLLSYYGQMALNPMAAMNLMGEAAKLIERMKTLNPDNPRIYLEQAEATYNMPREFGGGPEAARPFLVTAMEKFNKFVPDGPLAPDWGKERCEQLLQQAGEGQ